MRRRFGAVVAHVCRLFVARPLLLNLPLFVAFRLRATPESVARISLLYPFCCSWSSDRERIGIVLDPFLLNI